ncbi:hypothetical protein [Cytobacillus firmus]|uniref:hypothetical protein n=1 Tax=Cytobacillus firmus TaxID=1399 RepID=UPI001C8D2D28|nr:hypothetical protein [Cytobacillus firmus]MBX9976020.1 hypothetical protein [Cytobacillus firmus]
MKGKKLECSSTEFLGDASKLAPVDKETDLRFLEKEKVIKMPLIQIQGITL